MVQRSAYGALLVLGVAVLAGIAFTSGLWSRPPANAGELLGLSLPASVAGEQVELDRRGFGAYRAYVRFALDPADLTTLLNDPAFQLTTPGQPLTIFDNTQIGPTPLVDQVLAARPPWWRPDAAPQVTLAYRSRPGPNTSYTGPDAAWYLIDTSDPARAVVYVYIVEV